MKQVEIFDGNQLHENPIQFDCQNPKYAFIGNGMNGEKQFIPLNDDILSRHMVFLGGIGTGKTNAFFQIVRQIRR